MSRVDPSHGPKQPNRQKPVDVSRKLVALRDKTELVGGHALDVSRTILLSVARSLSLRSVVKSTSSSKPTTHKVGSQFHPKVVKKQE